MNTRLRRVVTVLSAVLLTAAATAVLSPPASAAANTIYVFPDGNDSNPDCGAEHSACATIQHAIDKAVAGDTVIAGSGTYAEDVTIDKAIAVQGDAATIAGTISVGSVDGAVTVAGFTVASDTAPTLISVADAEPSAAVSIADNTLTGNSATPQTGIAVAPSTSVSVTGNTLSLGSGGGAAISLSAPDPSDTLNVTTGGNTGTVAAPTRTIDESGAGPITVTPTGTPNTITPTGADLGVALPAKVFTGKDAVQFSGTVDSGGVELPHARYDITITGTSGITADQLVLQYLSGSTWLPFPLAGTASAGSSITGYFGPAAGFDLPPSPVTTTFRLAVADGAPEGPLSVVTTLDEVAQPSGTPILNTVASASGAVDIVTNQVPIATPQSVTAPFDGSLAITLSATDGDNDPLTYAVGTAPTHGTIDGTAPNLTYTPAQGYTGTDSFTFTANDGHDTSPPATVSITVPNQTPTADPQTLRVLKNGTKSIVLSGSDFEHETLTYALAAKPSHGSLAPDTGTVGAQFTDPNLTYTPTSGYSGPDSFTFTVSDGTTTSPPATVTLNVNHVPIAIAPSTVHVPFNGSAVVVATASDADGDALTYTPQATSAHNATVLGGTSDGHFTYTPAPNYSGPDSFTFTVSDGLQTSAPATVSLTVAANQPPVASDKSYSVTVGGTVAITLTATDPDGGTPTITHAAPDKGTITGTDPVLTYHAPTTSAGDAHFSYTAKDTHGATDTATITVHIARAKASIGAVTFSPAHPTSAQVPKATVAVSAAAGSVSGGTVTVTYGSTKRTAKVSGGKATVSLSKLTGGAHKFSIAFGGTATTSSATTTKSLSISKVRTTLTLSTSPKQLTTKSKGTLTVRVTATGASINGKTVTLRNGSRVVGTAKVVHRLAKIKLPKLSLGQHNWSVDYPGSTTAAPATKTVILRVALG